MSVGTFDPGAASRFELTADVIERLLAAASAAPPRFGLSDEEVDTLAPAATNPQWSDAIADLAPDQIVALIRLFTQGEGVLPGWQAGAKSPVVAMVARLRQIDECPADLTAWIKANTDNRFLPYGSLMDRLS